MEDNKGDEKKMDLTINKGYEDLNKMVGRVQDVLIFYSNFKYKLQVSKFTTELKRKFED